MMLQNKTFRAFIGIPLPAEVQEKIISLIQPLKKIDELKTLRWQKQENWHLTLLFLGHIDEEKCKQLIAEIKPRIFDFKSFLLNFCELKLFPNTKKPVAFILKPEEDRELKELAGKLNKAAEAIGFETEKRLFKPHLTVAKTDRKFEPTFKTNFEQIHVGDLSFIVEHFYLYKSKPSESGSQYTIIESF